MTPEELEELRLIWARLNGSRISAAYSSTIKGRHAILNEGVGEAVEELGVFLRAHGATGE